MITPARFRSLALALTGVEEVPHDGLASFRTKRRKIATLAADGAHAFLPFDRELQRTFCEDLPDVFVPMPGGFGAMGHTVVDLRHVREADLASALAASHALASEPKKRPKRR